MHAIDIHLLVIFSIHLLSVVPIQCLRFEPWVARWKADANPLNYVGIKRVVLNSNVAFLLLLVVNLY